MANFEKDLREFTDEELYQGINRHNPNYMALFSDELTRRSTDRWSQKMLDLTILLFFIGFMQLYFSLKSASKSLNEELFSIILVSFSIFYTMRLIKIKRQKSKK